jgi:hypothetical protein
MSQAMDISCVEDSGGDDNGFDWWSGFFRTGELDVTSVNAMVTKVLARCQGKPIRTLEIVGHAAPGSQSVGAGQASDRTGAKVLEIRMATGTLLGDAETQLLRLRGKFAPEAVITLGGCEVAQGPQGKALLQRISTLLGNIAVQGSEHEQNPLPGMEGNVIRCKGNSCWVVQAGRGSNGKKKK